MFAFMQAIGDLSHLKSCDLVFDLGTLTLSVCSLLHFGHQKKCLQMSAFGCSKGQAPLSSLPSAVCKAHKPMADVTVTPSIYYLSSMVPTSKPISTAGEGKVIAIKYVGIEDWHIFERDLGNGPSFDQHLLRGREGGRGLSTNQWNKRRGVGGVGMCGGTLHEGIMSLGLSQLLQIAHQMSEDNVALNH